MKKLVLIVTAFVFLFGTEFHESQNIQGKLSGTQTAFRSTFRNQYHIGNQTTSDQNETESKGYELTESTVKHFTHVRNGKIKILQTVVLAQASNYPLIFDLPPPYAFV